MVARARSVNFKEILSDETSIIERKFYNCDVGEVLSFPLMLVALSISSRVMQIPLYNVQGKNRFDR